MCYVRAIALAPRETARMKAVPLHRTSKIPGHLPSLLHNPKTFQIPMHHVRTDLQVRPLNDYPGLASESGSINIMET
jgi:hypothetical protein